MELQRSGDAELGTVETIGTWDRLSPMLLATGVGTALFYAFAYMFPATYFLLGGSLGAVSSTLLLTLAMAVGVYAAARMTDMIWWQILISVLVVIVVSSGLAGAVIDTSIDGQDYHYFAIQALAEGWNPVYSNAPMLAVSEEVAAPIWVDHYPIASWTVMAAEIAAGLPLEMAKGLAIAMMIAAALMTAGALMQLQVGLWLSLALAAIAAGNPVTLMQLFTRMNDGVMASCMLMVITLAVLATTVRYRGAFLAILPIMIFALNLKFSAIPIFVAVCASLCVAIYFSQGLKPAVRHGAYLAGAGIVGIFIIGFAPYANNILNFGHPFYPIMGPQDTRDIMLINTPERIEAVGPFWAFWLSLFSETMQGFAADPALKTPFMVSSEELRAAGGPDTRIAGFGPFFSGAFLVSLLLAATVAWLHRDNLKVRISLFSAVAMLLFTLIFPENWWARYVPQLWLLPLAVALACLWTAEARLRLATFALMGVMAVNAGLVFASASYGAVKRNAVAADQIRTLAASDATYQIEFDQALSRNVLFASAGVEFQTVAKVTRQDCARMDEISAYGPDRFGGSICQLPLEVD